MSHYRMAALMTESSPDIHELLAPYDENIQVEPYIEMRRDEALSKIRDLTTEAKNRVAAGNPTNRWDASLALHANDEDDDLLDWYATAHDVMRDEEGNFLTTYNPNSRYDYFVTIRTFTLDEWLASGTEVSEEDLRQEWETLSTQGDGLMSAEYYLDRYGDGDTFVKSCRLPEGWGVITPDGAWHEPGKVGWFAFDDSTADSRRDWVEHFHERFADPYKDKGITVHLLDCHI